VLQIFLNRAVWNMNIRDAIDTGRFHHQWLPDQVFYEPGALGWETVTELESRGYPLALRDRLGRAAGIEMTPEGVYAAHADRRGPGVAMGY
jgi:gamma-glutamyltranspeptidase/glutathione hydrolase